MAYKNFKLTEIIDEIGSELRKARLNKHETLASVSKILSTDGINLSSTMLGRIENGERRIDDELFYKLCEHYDINPFLTIISASQQHINDITAIHHSETISDFTVSSDKDNIVLSLYNNLNPEGQHEVKSLMRMMAYMNAFKKTE